MARVLFVHPSLSSFVERDLRILRGAHEVAPLHFRGVGDLPTLATAVAWCDLTFSWFGSIHAFFAVALSKLLRKPSVVVAGGYDVAKEPEIGYGLATDRRKAWCPRFVFRNADLTLAVSECSRREAIENAGADPERVRLLYHGFETEQYRPMAGIARNEAVLTVAGGVNQEPIKKGLDLFVETARYMPHVPFRLVGPWVGPAGEALRAEAFPNVAFDGPLYGDDLLRAYSGAKVYAQLSQHESFCSTVAEAMLCECVPVVSRRGALPEVVGDCGFYVERRQPEEVAQTISEALHSNLGRKARERICQLFPVEKRRQALLQAVGEV